MRAEPVEGRLDKLGAHEGVEGVGCLLHCYEESLPRLRWCLARFLAWRGSGTPA
jgi:hypothetical protein